MFPPISNFIDEYRELKDYLLSNDQVTMSTTVESHFRKVFLLSCASYYENEITDIIKSFIQSKSADERILKFATIKAIDRQYHTYFDWDKSNVNKFLSLFGTDFKNRVSENIRKDHDLDDKMKAFIEIGSERNKMVHENYLIYNLEKTFDEIKVLNEKAIGFIEYIRTELS